MVTALQTLPVTTPPSRTAGLDHPATWFCPQSLWRVIQRGELPARRGQPVLLRFATDDFMARVIQLLASGRADELGAYVAQPETWQTKDVGLDTAGRDKPGSLKLYQPSQNRFYLVAGALACRLPGIPDRTIDGASDESAFFVLRRVVGGVEYGWATGRDGEPVMANEANGVPKPGYQRTTGKGWVALADPEHMRLCDEERYPLFPMSFQQDGVTRRLLAGLVPVSSRETYQAGPLLSPFPSAAEYALPGGDPRPALFEQQVTAPLAGLQAWYAGLTAAGGPGVGPADQRQIERTTAYTLLDLMALLRAHVRSLYDSIMTGSSVPIGASWPLAFLIGLTSAGGRALADVLKKLEEDRDEVAGLGPDDELDADWLFPWVGPDRDFSAWLSKTEAEIAVPQPDGTTRTERVSGPVVQVFFHQALAQPYVPQPQVAALTERPEVPKLDGGGDAVYTIRMVYDRPECPFPIISQPTRAFKLASFFDPDAPARPIRIAMPLDTSTEGLRKFDRGVSIQLSNQLRSQMARVTDLKKLMDGEVGEEPSLDLGMVCSLSIPIITIVALILLMIFVQLLNIIFWWLPFFKICLPLSLSRE